jgi:hypothetical protein
VADQEFGLVRFAANGVLDPTFGTDGIVNTAIGPQTASPGLFPLQPKGQIVIAGLEAGTARSARHHHRNLQDL